MRDLAASSESWLGLCVSLQQALHDCTYAQALFSLDAFDSRDRSNLEPSHSERGHSSDHGLETPPLVYQAQILGVGRATYLS